MSTPEGGFSLPLGSLELGGIWPAAGHDCRSATGSERDRLIHRVTPGQAERQAGREAVAAAVRVDDGARQGRRPKGPSRLNPASERARGRHDRVRGWVELAGVVQLSVILAAANERVELDTGFAKGRKLPRGCHENLREPRMVERLHIAADEVDGVEPSQLAPGKPAVAAVRPKLLA